MLRPFGSAHIETASPRPLTVLVMVYQSLSPFQVSRPLQWFTYVSRVHQFPSGWVDVTSIYPHCPTASYLSSLTRHFVVGISRMEVIAHARTSSNDRRSHRYDTGISSEYVIDFYCPFGPPPLILSLACDTILIISQEALFCYPHRFRLTSILPSIAGELGFSFKVTMRIK